MKLFGYNFHEMFFFAGALLGLALSGCDGSGDGNDNPLTYTASGTVTGANGPVVLTYNSQSFTINQSGSFQLPGTFADNSDISLAIQQSPAQQQCVLTNPVGRHVSSANVTDINITCSYIGQVSGRVTEYYSGTAIADAQVTVSANRNNQQVLIGTATSDASGAFTITGIGVSDRIVVSALHAGYGEISAIYSNSATTPNITGNIALLAAHATTTFDPAAAAILSVNGAQIVSLPANALRYTDGSIPNGPVTATITLIDPSSDTRVMPGNYQTRDSNGATRYIESFGAVSVQFVDANGRKLQLAQGQTATLSIPVALNALATAPASVPLFYFDEASGYWVQEGSAQRQTSGGSQFYMGQVSHFTVWNADQIYETVNVDGCLQDGAGNPVPLASVSSFGSSYIGSSQATSDATGRFTIPVRRDSTLLISATAGSQSQTQEVTSADQPLTLPTCLILAPNAGTIKLTWGENPEDLDSHLVGPNGAGGTFHIYFGNQSVDILSTLVSLDVDDVTSFGPEIISIPRFPVAGTYKYTVNLYSGTGTIRQSPARVEVNLGGNTTVFSPAAANGADSEYWHVFDIVVDASLNATLAPVQQFESSLPAAQTPVVLLRAARTPQPGVVPQAMQSLAAPLVNTKYYTK